MSDLTVRKEKKTRTIFTFSQKFVLSNAPITRTFANSNYFHGPLEVRVIGIIYTVYIFTEKGGDFKSGMEIAAGYRISPAAYWNCRKDFGISLQNSPTA